jgi:hypothetical protein
LVIVEQKVVKLKQKRQQKHGAVCENFFVEYRIVVRLQQIVELWEFFEGR